MGVKDIKEPKPKAEKKPPKTKPDSEDKSSPWKVTNEGKRVRSGRALPHEIRLREFFAGLAGVAALAGDNFTGAAIEAKAEELAYGYAKLAQSDPRVKQVIAFLLEGSAWTEAIIPTVGLVIVVGWHYGVIPDQVGVPMTMANGLMPVTREQEAQMRAQQKREQQQAAEEHSRGQNDGGKPS